MGKICKLLIELYDDLINKIEGKFLTYYMFYYVFAQGKAI